MAKIIHLVDDTGLVVDAAVFSDTAAVSADGKSVAWKDDEGETLAFEAPAGQSYTDLPGAVIGARIVKGAVVPPAASPSPPVDLAALKAMLCADIDRQAEAQRLRYVTDGSTKAMVYLQKQSQASAALNALKATPPMTADQAAAAYVLLAAEVGITVDPSTGQPAADAFGVARAVVAVVAMWLPLAAAIERACAAGKAATSAATTAEGARAAHDAVAWPSPPSA